MHLNLCVVNESGVEPTIMGFPRAQLWAFSVLARSEGQLLYTTEDK